jgi:hypothetical protein
MSHTKRAARQKRRTKVAPVLGAVGLSLSLASFASAIGRANQDMDPAFSAAVTQQEMDEEEISDTSLATFNVFDKENAGTQRQLARPGMIVSQGACGADLYYPQTPRSFNRPAYQSPPTSRPRPIRPSEQIQTLVAVAFAKLSELLR